MQNDVAVFTLNPNMAFDVRMRVLHSEVLVRNVLANPRPGISHQSRCLGINIDLVHSHLSCTNRTNGTKRYSPKYIDKSEVTAAILDVGSEIFIQIAHLHY